MLGVFAFLAFTMWLRDRRRGRDAISIAREALAQGQTLPPEVWDRLLEPTGAAGSPAPWMTAVTFAALTVGFAVIALVSSEEETRLAFGVVAAVMALAGLASGVSR
jgi:hypothetical protein